MSALDWSRAAVVTCTEFEVSWERLGLGETPWQLEPQRRGMTAPERCRIVEDVAVDLRRRGLADPHGLRPDLAAGLRLLARPAWSMDVRLRHRTMVAGVAACAGNRCILAVRQADEIALLPLHADAAVTALLDLLGPITPGTGREIRIPAEVFDAARGAAPDHPERFADELVARGTAQRDADALVEMCSAVDLRGQLGASAASGDGQRARRGRYVIGIHRGSAGHIRQVRGRQPGIVCVGPTTEEALLTELGELTRSARHPHC